MTTLTRLEHATFTLSSLANISSIQKNNSTELIYHKLCLSFAKEYAVLSNFLTNDGYNSLILIVEDDYLEHGTFNLNLFSKFLVKSLQNETITCSYQLAQYSQLNSILTVTVGKL